MNFPKRGLTSLNLSFTLKDLLDCGRKGLKSSGGFSTSSGECSPSSILIEGIGVYAIDVETRVDENELGRGRR